MKKLITAVTATAVLFLAPTTTPAAHAAGEQIIYSFCSDTQDIASLNWFDADNEQQVRSAIRLTNREAGRWCGTTRLTSRSTYQMTASAIQTEGTYAACAISVNNKTTATDYATGRYAVAMCAS